MNRKDFKSAYDKITLSDECRAEMKNKLMAAMEQKNSSGEFEDDGLLHSTQEIKLAPRKRSARENRRDSRFGGGSHRGVRGGGGRNAQPERHS